jgi:hypothetical protein
MITQGALREFDFSPNIFWIIKSRCVGSFVHQQRVFFGCVACWFLRLPTEGIGFLGILSD